VNGITRLEPEKQDGPCEYKLHLLLRSRRKFVSMTTATDTSNLHAKPGTPVITAVTAAEVSNLRASYQPSPQTRQARLQQLTTQLLWRLQQSSPFHSSSNSQLVLPVLPEATPRLGVPEKPARLLPGLEESQGALYELGVADDGTLVGLVEDELDESLNNLRAMAASLGCVCEVLLKSAIGLCEWETTHNNDGTGDRTVLHHGQLFVAEILVRPDSNAATASSDSVLPILTTSDANVPVHSNHDIDQLRIAFVGASTAGKSTLVGTLTGSMLDNGRGKSRLSLLKHRHEIASGITSSVAHELIGYRLGAASDEYVVNYAAGDVSSWTDIHNIAERQCFLIDSPGLIRYAKSTFRSLVSWHPHWVIICVASDEDEDASSRLPQSSAALEAVIVESTISLAYLTLCLRLELPIVIAITKMDLATKSGLKTVLSKVLSALKAAGRQPMLLSSPSLPIPGFALDSNQALPDLQQISPVEAVEMKKAIETIQLGESKNAVPIIMTSAVSGAGIGKLHGLLGQITKSDPIVGGVESVPTRPRCLFYVDEVFSIPPSKVYSTDAVARLEGQGIVLCGRVERGSISVGDTLCLGPLPSTEIVPSFVAARSKSYSAQDVRRNLITKPASLAKSLQEANPLLPANEHLQDSTFVTVRVVSVRSLRLPVLGMESGETGTIGVELSDANCDAAVLQRTKKGMVLLSSPCDLAAYRSFTATFPATDFVASSPPLILGGHAQAYVNSIRAAVKVTAVALADDEVESSSPAEVFTFDDDDEEGSNSDKRQEKEIKITFRFMNTVEWMETGDKVLVVPNVASGPVAGQIAPNTSLLGFVGRINELHR
jgi:GTPase